MPSRWNCTSTVLVIFTSKSSSPDSYTYGSQSNPTKDCRSKHCSNTIQVCQSRLPSISVAQDGQNRRRFLNESLDKRRVGWEATSKGGEKDGLLDRR